jgi:hypothetical protein
LTGVGRRLTHYLKGTLMSNRSFFPLRGSLNREIVKLYGTITTTTSGAIGSQTGKGFSAARTAAGRYVVTLQDAYTSLVSASVSVQGGATAAYTAGKGQNLLLRSVTPTTKALTLQLTRPDTQADADPEDGALLYVEITLSRV